MFHPIRFQIHTSFMASIQKSFGHTLLKVGFHTTDFIAMAQKAQELSVGACVE